MPSTGIRSYTGCKARFLANTILEVGLELFRQLLKTTKLLFGLADACALTHRSNYLGVLRIHEVVHVLYLLIEKRRLTYISAIQKARSGTSTVIVVL